MRWVVLATLCLAGCGEREAMKAPAEPPAAAASATPQPAEAPASVALTSPRAVATLRGKVRGDQDELTIAALSAPVAAPDAADADAADVSAIEIRGSDGVLRQRIAGLSARVASAAGRDALELVDLDFDGHADLRLMEAPSAGPNTTHLNWLFDSGSQRFVPFPALDELPGVQVVAAARELRSEWRDGPATYGTGAYVIRDGRLVPVRRERRTYSQPGRFMLEVSRPEGKGWKVVEKRAGSD